MRTLGWREWVALPELGITGVKAKIDTGARTSSLDTTDLTEFLRDGERWVRFTIYPLQETAAFEVACEARVVDLRWVTNSGGRRDQRYVISTSLAVDGEQWPIELTLAQRADMTFRMLLGRTALRKRALIDPSRSFMTGLELHHAYAHPHHP